MCLSSLRTPVASGDGITARGDFYLDVFSSLELAHVSTVDCDSADCDK